MSLSSFQVGFELAFISTSPIAVIKGVIQVESAVGDFVATGPDTGLAGAVRDGYRTRCRQFANVPLWAKLLSPSASGALSRICTPYLDGIGFDGPVIAPPDFTGGQCPGVSYFFDYQFNRVGTDGATLEPPVVVRSQGFNFGYLGPISGLEAIFTPGSGTELNLRHNGTISSISFSTASQGDFRNAKILAVFPRNGAADDCGSLPPTFKPGPNPPPNPPPTPGPEPTDDPRNPTGVPLLPLPDYEDPIGGPTPIVGPEQNLPTLTPEDIPGSSDSQDGGSQNAGDPLTGESGVDGGGDDIVFAAPPPGRVWVGALLQLVIPGQYGIIPNSGPANPVAARVVGNASLTYEGGRGTAERVRSGNIELFRPNGALRVVGLYVNFLPGITYTVRPISVLKCPENNCGETP